MREPGLPVFEMRVLTKALDLEPFCSCCSCHVPAVVKVIGHFICAACLHTALALIEKPAAAKPQLPNPNQLALFKEPTQKVKP